MKQLPAPVQPVLEEGPVVLRLGCFVVAARRPREIVEDTVPVDLERGAEDGRVRPRGVLGCGGVLDEVEDQ
jgi:hypothetical protein